MKTLGKGFLVSLGIGIFAGAVSYYEVSKPIQRKHQNWDETNFDLLFFKKNFPSSAFSSQRTNSLTNSLTTKGNESENLVEEKDEFTENKGNFGNLEFSDEMSKRIYDISLKDNAGVGYCARGTANILKSLGHSGFHGINAHDFPERLQAKGWRKLEGVTPDKAPVGSVITFNSDLYSGGRPRNRGGGLYGHVEIKVQINGKDWYVSDKPRQNWGGSVPDRFTGVWVYEG